MRVLNVGDAMERITNALSILTTNVKLHNSRGRTDINKDAEDFYCGLLSIVLSKNLKNLNLLEMNFAAIDLADEEGRLCVQVTSTEGRNKVDRTLEKFFAKELDKKFDWLIVLIIGEKPQYQRDFKTERGFDFDHERDVWDLPKLLSEIERLDAERVEEVDEYLSPRVNTGRQEKQYPNLPLRTTLEGDAFIGRAGELEEIDRRFRTERVLFLTGLGGMGKTELAVRYARNYVQAKGHQVYMVLFSGNFRQTMLNNVAPNIPDLDTNGMHENEIYRKTLESLNRCGADALLILDNADQANLMDLRRDLGALAMRVLVTTRQDVERAIDVDQLHREELHRLFDQHEAQVTPEEMDKLVDAVDGHTLTVDLMARALRPGFRAATVEKLLHNLGDSSVKKVKSAYPGRSEQARINEHLQAVFQVVELSGAERKLLYFATLLPEGGMDAELFLQPFEEDLGDDLGELIRSGWLMWKDDLLRIHPVIRLVCIEDRKPTDVESAPFLNYLWDWYTRSSYEMAHYEQVAESFAKAGELLTETEKWNGCAVEILRKLNQGQRAKEDYKNALKYSLRMAQILEKQKTIGVVEDQFGLADSYDCVSNDYKSMGYDREANEYNTKAIRIRGLETLMRINLGEEEMHSD